MRLTTKSFQLIARKEESLIWFSSQWSGVALVPSFRSTTESMLESLERSTASSSLAIQLPFVQMMAGDTCSNKNEQMLSMAFKVQKNMQKRSFSHTLEKLLLETTRLNQDEKNLDGYS